jgi:hypothetical protein
MQTTTFDSYPLELFVFWKIAKRKSILVVIFLTVVALILIRISLQFFSESRTTLFRQGDWKDTPSPREQSGDSYRLSHLNEPSKLNGEELCVIIRTMPKHLPNLPALIFSLFVGGYLKVRPIILPTYNTKGNTRELNSIKNYVNMAIPSSPVEISSLDSSITQKLYPDIKYVVSTGDGGFPVTDMVIEDIIVRRKEIRKTRNNDKGFCDAILVTNGDNLYGASFVPVVMETLFGENAYDLVATHFISRYLNDELNVERNRNRGLIGGPSRLGRDFEFISSFQVGGLDLGAGVVRTSTLEDSGIRFVLDRLNQNPTGVGIDFVEADGQYFERLSQSPGVRSIVIPRSLFIHQ